MAVTAVNEVTAAPPQDGQAEPCKGLRGAFMEDGLTKTTPAYRIPAASSTGVATHVLSRFPAHKGARRMAGETTRSAVIQIQRLGPTQL